MVVNNEQTEQTNGTSKFLLPKLNDIGDRGGLQPSIPGKWDVRPSDTFQTIATSLHLGDSQSSLKTITAIPSIWARAIFVETALHERDYPLKDKLVEQWIGMLAAIALAEVRRFDIKVQFVKLDDPNNFGLNELNRKSDRFSRSLSELLPEPTYALYGLRERTPDRENNPWQELYIFLWGYQLATNQEETSLDLDSRQVEYNVVGISSPSTLVCPSEEGKWTGLPWYEEKGRLSYPDKYLNFEEKALLWRWLENIINNLRKYGGVEDARNSIIGLLQRYSRKLLRGTPKRELKLVEKPNCFGEPINVGALELLNKPIKPLSKPSSVRVIPEKKETAPDLLIIDPKIDEIWHKEKQEIWIYEDTTLATGDILQELRQGNIFSEDQQGRTVKWLESKDLLLEEFYFINQDKALLGSLRPKVNGIPLKYEDKPITPLIPLNTDLLDYFTPDSLADKITLEMSGENRVKVSLTLELSGFPSKDPSKNDSPKDYTYSKIYELKQENAIAAVPVLELWPNFQAKGWKEYYTFYYDRDQGERTFQVKFSGEVKSQNFKEGKGYYQISKLETFPTHITCCKNSPGKKEIGLIFLSSPPTFGEIDSGSWKVGVDFGTSFTNVYVNQNDTPERLKLEPLNLHLTKSDPENRRGVLIEFFTTDNKTYLDLPLSTVLTTRVKTQRQNQEKRERTEPHLDGCIYIPESSTTLQPQKPYIKTGLKWSEDVDKSSFAKLFLKHLALQISALAKTKNVSHIDWYVSYPSAFSIYDQNGYRNIWIDIARELEKTTGVKYTYPDPNTQEHWSKHWRSESISFAQFFVDQQEHADLVYSTCIDIGGGTSDISIVENNQLLHQCSIQLAGSHLFTQFLELNRPFLQKYFGVNQKDWEKLKGPRFSAKLDLLLYRESEKWLKEDRNRWVKDPKFQGLLQLLALGTAGLYYYVGIILKTLHDEGIYTRGQITPVYLGGNGARFLHWLANFGQFNHTQEINKLFSRMLERGSRFKNVQNTVARSYLSSFLKDEVACGLVLSDTPLSGWDDEEIIKTSLVAGEYCEVNGVEVFPYKRLTIGSNITIDNFKIPESFNNLHEFVNAFNRAVVNLELKDIQPIELNDNDFSETHRELTAYLLRTQGLSFEKVRVEPPFVLALKSLLRVKGKKWAGIQ